MNKIILRKADSKDSNNNSVIVMDVVSNSKYELLIEDINFLLDSLDVNKITPENLTKRFSFLNINLESLPLFSLNTIYRYERHNWQLSLIYLIGSSKNFKFIDQNDISSDIRIKSINEILYSRNQPTFKIKQGERIKLKFSNSEKQKPLLNALLERRTFRVYDDVKKMTFSVFSNIIINSLKRIQNNKIASQAVNENKLNLLKSYGVAFDFYIVVYSVENLVSGIYQLDVINLDLVLIREGNFRNKMNDCLWNQQAPLSACYSIVMSIDFDQYQYRYKHERALRNLFIEVGRISQYVVIEAEKFNVKSLTTPAMNDIDISNMLNINPLLNYPIYSITQGYAK